MDGEIRITRGVPTDEELAALVGVLLTAARTTAVPGPDPVSLWARSGRPGAGHRGPGAWRASSRPTHRIS